jgi:hypothetical protein
VVCREWDVRNVVQRFSFGNPRVGPSFAFRSLRGRHVTTLLQATKRRVDSF